MASTSTTRLALFKPVPGSSEPFRASDFNANMDKIDAEAVAVDTRLDVIEGQNLNTRVTTLEGQNLNSRITTLEGQNLNTRLTSVEGVNTTQNNRLTALETAIDGGTP